MAMFPFTGWDERSHGDLHIQGKEGGFTPTGGDDAVVWRWVATSGRSSDQCRRHEAPSTKLRFPEKLQTSKLQEQRRRQFGALRLVFP
jgi:hypothetical protein